VKIVCRLAVLVLGGVCVGCGNAKPAENARAQPAVNRQPTEAAQTSIVRDRGLSTASARGAIRAVDLEGHSVNPFGDAGAKAVVFVFVCTDCPVVNRYAPDIERLYEAYRQKHVAFWLVYADPREEPAKIRRHLKEYGYKVAAVREPEYRLVKLCRVTKTPEAVLFSPEGTQAYRGRIDDRFTDYGKARSAPSREDLREAIDCVLQGRPVPVATTQVVGCFIPESR
jgi:hypothetical protein